MKKSIMILLLALLATMQAHAVTKEGDTIWVSGNEYWDLRRSYRIYLEDIIKKGVTGTQLADNRDLRHRLPDLWQILNRNYHSDSYVVSDIYDQSGSGIDPGPYDRWGFRMRTKP